MALFYKSAEDYIKQIIRIALKLQNRLNKGDYEKAITFLALILKIDGRLYRKIEEETKSKELLEQSQLIRRLAERALIEARHGNYTNLKDTISMIIKGGEKYLISEEKFVGFSISEKKLNIMKQAKFVSDYITNITFQEAMILLIISYSYGLDVVIGGSSLKNNMLGGDLDLGFKPSRRHLTISNLEFITKFVPRKGINLGQENKLDKAIENLIGALNKEPYKLGLSGRVSAAINKINKFAFKWYRNKFKKPLIRDKFIYDGYRGTNLMNIPAIFNVKEFFFRRGFRKERHTCLDKNGRSFAPSGYLYLKLNGTTILALPRFRKGVVGEVVFY